MALIFFRCLQLYSQQIYEMHVQEVSRRTYKIKQKEALTAKTKVINA